MSLVQSFARSKRTKPAADPSAGARAKPLRLLTARSEWLAQVEQCTALVREQKARELEARSRAVGLERRREWREERNVWRDRRTGRTSDNGNRASRPELVATDRARIFNDPRARAGSENASYVARAWDPELAETDERIGGAPPLESRWHTSRAEGKRELFDRVSRCGSGDGHRITLVCRGCKASMPIEVGCNSHWFCAACRARTANKFRADFETKRLGLVSAATRAGLTRRRQPKENRWGERLLTVTLPHVGTAAERVRVLKATWTRFWRTLRDAERPTLQSRSGITIADIPRGMSERAIQQREAQAQDRFDNYNKLRRTSRKIGPLQWKKQIEFFPADSGLGWQSLNVELSLWDMFSYLHVFEWTPGDDGQGHPHMHVWIFSRYLDRDKLQDLWERAYAHVTGEPVRRLALVHIEKAGDDVAHELVKYLTKDWEISSSGAKRAAPEVFASIYAELDGKRLRQSSSGLSMWAVAKVVACPCCGFERERGHWARVDIDHKLEHHKDPLGHEARIGWYWGPEITIPLLPAHWPTLWQPMPLAGAGGHALQAAHDAQKDVSWAASTALRVLREKLRHHADLSIPHACDAEPLDFDPQLDLF